MKILNVIRNEAKVPLPRLREVKEGLAHLGDDMWARTTLYLLNREVIFHNPATNRKEDVRTGQAILQIPLQIVTSDMEAAVRDLRKRDEATIGKIDRKRGIAGNRPVISGTRIRVSAIKAFRDAGYSIKQILEQYPALTEADVKAALEHGKAV